MRKLFTLFLLLPLLLVFSCKENPEGKIKEKAKQIGWNKDMAEIAFVAGLRHLMGEEVSDKKGTFRVSGKRIKVEDALKKVNEDLLSLDGALNPADDRWRKYLEVNNLKAEFERERLIRKLIRDRLQLVYLNGKFYELMGLSMPSDDYYGGTPYSLKFLLSDDELKKYDFVAKMEELKREKKFKESQEVAYFINDDFAYKIPDPNYPNDKNRFLWKKIRRGLKIKTYIIASENPAENSGEYIEAYRLKIIEGNGKETVVTESKPAARIFSGGHRKLNVAVIDGDFEGAYGFGIPDEIVEISNLKNGADMLKNEQILALLFKEKEKEYPLFVKKEMNVEIIRAGEAPIEEWETISDISGWQIGLKYKDQSASNYKAKVVYKNGNGAPKEKSGEPQEDGQNYSHHSGKKKIEAFAKEYLIPGTETSVQGEVVEYYKPAAPYDKNNVIEVEVNGKKITIYREGESAVSGMILPKKNTFIEDVPFRIDYTEGGQRWRLEDRDGDGVLESRKRISPNGKKEIKKKKEEADETEGIIGE